MSTKHLAGYTLCQKHAKHFQKKHVPTPETGRKEEATLQAPTIQQDQIEEYTTETTEEDRMREQNEQTEENTEQDVQPAETEQSEETAFTENCADAGMVLELDFNALDDIVMNFLEGAEAEFTYHQAEIIRTAYVGLKTEHSINATQYMLDRARKLAPNRPKAKKIDDPFNEYISDFVEHSSGHLSFIETEIIRRAARGCDSESIDELQYLLNRARRKLTESVSSAS